MGYGTYWFASDQFGFGTGLDEFCAAFAVPFLLALSLLNVIVFLGIASSEVDDSALEWWSRTCGWNRHHSGARMSWVATSSH